MLAAILPAYFQSRFTHCQLWQLAWKTTSRQAGKFKPTRQIQCHCHHAVPGLPGGTAPRLGACDCSQVSQAPYTTRSACSGYQTFGWAEDKHVKTSHSSAPHTCPQSPATVSTTGQGSETPPLQASPLRGSTNWPGGRSPFHHLGGYGLWLSNSAALCPTDKDQFQCTLLGCQ